NPFDAVELVRAQTITNNPKSNIYVWDPNSPATDKYIAYDNATSAQLKRATGVKIALDDPLPVGVTFRAEITVILRDPPPAAGTVIRNCFTLQAEANGKTVPDKPGGHCRDVTVVDVPDAATATLGKNIVPATILRPTPGLPDQKVTVKHTLLNDGPLYLNEIGFTDTDTDFFDAVNFVGNIYVNKPPGANRVKVDVCTGDCQTPTWIEGTPVNSKTPSIPLNINPSDVNGIRVTFSVNGGGFKILKSDKPPTGGQCPNANVCFDVTARETLKSDGTTAIPNPLADTSNGSFESRLGIAPFPDVNASVNVTQGDPELKIEKTPKKSIVGPGTPQPMNLKITNKGSWPIKNPTVVDPLPKELTLLTDQIGTTSYPFEITAQDLPGSYDPLPTKDTNLVFVETKDPLDPNRVDKLQWTLGQEGVDDWQLPPGASFTIKFFVVLTAGDEANTTIRNTAAAGGSGFQKKFCAQGNGRVTGSPFGDGDFCTSSNEIKTLAGQDALGSKWSAADKSLGWYHVEHREYGTVGDPTLDCPEFVDNSITYTRYPCVPLVGPGGTIDFLIDILNEGTVPLQSAILVDGFPVRTDTGVLLTTSQRDTEWGSRPTLKGSVQSSPAATINYTDISWPQTPLCTAQLTNPANGACPVSSFDDAASAQSTAFRASFAFNPELPGGERATLRYQMAAPVTPDAAANTPLAWNSFGYAATADTPFDSEPRKAGVGMLQGGITVTKQVNGPDPGVDL
ncbi:MAG: hypothetical protein ABGX05_05335, partial [Pirellulaceae bacterium]